MKQTVAFIVNSNIEQKPFVIFSLVKNIRLKSILQAIKTVTDIFLYCRKQCKTQKGVEKIIENNCVTKKQKLAKP